MADTPYAENAVYVVMTRSLVPTDGDTRRHLHSPQVLPAPHDLDMALARLKANPDTPLRSYAARFLGRDPKLGTDLFLPLARLRLSALDKREVRQNQAPGYNAVMRFLEGEVPFPA